MNIGELRKEYKNQSLTKANLLINPFDQFEVWFQEAIKAQVIEPNAMFLATASLQGHPSSRTVLLKQIDSKGLVFFTNYNSRKGQELESNPYASATFWWRDLERQVIVEGSVVKTSKEEAQFYFASRPRGSQLSTWASQQDQPINSKKNLEEKFQEYENLYFNKEIPMPPYWGGFRVIPSTFEFWQGRVNRLHDRFRYSLKNQEWVIGRLSP